MSSMIAPTPRHRPAPGRTGVLLRRGRYAARLAETEADIAVARALRVRAFGPAGGEDRFDTACLHVLVEEVATGTALCTYRLLPLTSGAEIDRSYSAQVYDLGGLARFPGPMLELGRFCIPDGPRDADILRVAWGAMTGFVDAAGVDMLFGCASFSGTLPGRYRESFALLDRDHLAPPRWRPRARAPEVVEFARPSAAAIDRAAALRAMPPLLRSYLAMGGRVSDHAVVDRAMNTLHVFTGVEIGAIPPDRARSLRAVAAG